MKINWKNLLYAVPLAMALVGMAAAFIYGLKKQQECEANGGVLIRASFGSECVKLERR
jgi:hypothetical protein